MSPTERLMTMIPRVLEPEVMDTVKEALEYDAMDHSEVNRLFVAELLSVSPPHIFSTDEEVLDVGTGTALIPIDFCRQSSQGRIVAVDLAEEMLRVARANVERAQLLHRITLQHCDAKVLPFLQDRFAAVISNSIIHHVPDPMIAFREMIRVLKPGGLLFVRDLLRPVSTDIVESLVDEHAGGETEYSQQLLRQSLHAAFTLEEIQQMLRELELPEEAVSATSDRHWTMKLILE